jgi:hypothetical protein
LDTKLPSHSADLVLSELPFGKCYRKVDVAALLKELHRILKKNRQITPSITDDDNDGDNDGDNGDGGGTTTKDCSRCSEEEIVHDSNGSSRQQSKQPLPLLPAAASSRAVLVAADSSARALRKSLKRGSVDGELAWTLIKETVRREEGDDDDSFIDENPLCLSYFYTSISICEFTSVCVCVCFFVCPSYTLGLKQPLAVSGIDAAAFELEPNPVNTERYSIHLRPPRKENEEEK